MKYALVIQVLLLLACPAPAQEFTGPAEIVRIMEASRLTYLMDLTDAALVDTPEARPNHSYTYQVPEGDGYTIETYALAPEAHERFLAAERAFALKQYDSARSLYSRVLDAEPDFAPAMTFIGQSLMMEERPQEGEEWFLRALEVNYMDYLPHWFLADLWWKRGEHERAAREITLAWVLNRRNRNLETALKTIYKDAGLKFRDFFFLPNISLEQEGDTVKMRFSEEWMSYALCRAIWAYEPHYAHERGKEGDEKYDLDREMECLLNLDLAHRNDRGKHKKSKVEALNALADAVDTRYLREFVFFELWLPREPAIVYTQPREAIDAIAEYVWKVRGKQ